jgi:hypothetical protein
MLMLLCSLLFTQILSAQNFPTDAKVLQDVKNYHGKIATAKVQNEWKLEKEAGYTFSNMAKRVVAAKISSDWRSTPAVAREKTGPSPATLSLPAKPSDWRNPTKRSSKTNCSTCSAKTP